MTARLILKILFSKGKGWFLFLAFLGVFLGSTMTSFFVGIHSRLEVSASQAGESSFLIINKDINLLNSILGSRSHFTEAELNKIQEAPYFSRYAPFTPAHFSVTGNFQIASGLSTNLFLESVPSDMLDGFRDEFRWVPGDYELPLLISSEFLNLYNFGFSMAMGFPQVNIEALSKIPVRLTVSGPKGSKTITAKVIGVSDRIPSILAPKEFIDWGNKTLAKDGPLNPSRVITEVKPNANKKELAKWIKVYGWKINTEQMGSDKIRELAVYALWVLEGFGIAFSILALFIIISQLKLITLRHTNDWRRLIEMGYKPGVFSKYYMLILGVGSFVSFLLSVAALSFLMRKASYIGMKAGFLWYPGIGVTETLILFSVLTFMLLISWINLEADKRTLLKNL